MPVSMSGSWNISGNVAMDQTTPFTAVAGSTTNSYLIQNQPIVNFNPFSSVTGGYSPYKYFISLGVLPPGLTLNPTTGILSGTPTTVQNGAPVVFAVQDFFGNISGTTVTINFFVAISSIIAVAGSTTTVSALQNVAITSFTPFSSVYNGYQPYTFYIVSGTLPTGITLNSSSGIVSGTSSSIYGPASVVFGVRDSSNTSASTTVSVSFTVAPVTYTLNYLVVGGGGSANFGGGGGGAFIPGTVCVGKGQPYTITVGGAGAPSSFSGYGVPGITGAAGGNGGPFGASPQVGNSSPNGSGGGGGINPYFGPSVTPASWGAGGTAGNPGISGYPGGPAGGSYIYPNIKFMEGGGGGGGAGSAGTNGYAAACNVAQGGQGGQGAYWPYTGGTLYASGGGGGYYNYYPTTSYGYAGANPGPGAMGSGGGYNAPVGAQGGGVLFAVPNAAYPGTVLTGTYSVSTPPSAPGYTVITYTGPGTYTA